MQLVRTRKSDSLTREAACYIDAAPASSPLCLLCGLGLEFSKPHDFVTKETVFVLDDFDSDYELLSEQSFCIGFVGEWLVNCVKQRSQLPNCSFGRKKLRPDTPSFMGGTKNPKPNVQKWLAIE